MTDFIGVLMFIAMVFLIVYGMFLAMEATEQEIRQYCNKTPNATLKGDLEFNCSNLLLAEVGK